MKIIYHNENIDFVKLIEQSCSNYIGLDISDFQNFTKNGRELHTFISIENGENRIKRGLEQIFKNDENQFILHEAKSFMILFSYSSDSKSPLLAKEIQESNEILNKYLSDKDILWGLTEYKELTDSVKVIILAKI